MKTTPFDIDVINEFYREQFAAWPEVEKRYAALGRTERRAIPIDGFPVYVQHNPQRIKSTGADVSAKALEKRPCFLCEPNRPAEQMSSHDIEGFEILINPYPIFPVHFTIVSRDHRPQDAMPIGEMVQMVDSMPSLVAFFNGAKSGASAPDHLHFQAVLKQELPLLKWVEEHHAVSDEEHMTLSTPLMQVESFVVTPDLKGMQLLMRLPAMGGIDPETGKETPDYSNSFVWKDAKGWLRVAIVPRAKHRPDCYYAEDADKLLVSPGAIDMAGVFILPREEDYRRISEADIRQIFSETACRKS